MMAVKLAKDIEVEEWGFFLRGSDNIYDRK